MTTFNAEVANLTKHGLLPDENYVGRERFTTPFENNGQFWEGLGAGAALPIVTGLGTVYYALGAVWATLRAVGNLLILKPGYAGEALKDLGIDLTLSLCLGVMAPIHALASAIELLTRTVSSWFTGEEPRKDLSKLGFIAKFAEENAKRDDLLPSSTYLNKARFFGRYNNVFEFLGQLINPAIIGIDTGINCLYRALLAANASIQCLVNLVICKPRHAKDNLVDFGVNLSLSASLLVMTPVNAIVEAIALITRLGATWLNACFQGDEQHHEELQVAHAIQ